MDGIASTHKDEDSDYGSDLNSDEEVSLTELLQQAPVKQGTAPPLLLRDIEDNEGPKTARLPRALGRNRHEYGKRPATPVCLPDADPGKRIPIEVEGYRSASAPCKSVSDLRAALIDDEASSRKLEKPCRENRARCFCRTVV